MNFGQMKYEVKKSFAIPDSHPLLTPTDYSAKWHTR